MNTSKVLERIRESTEFLSLFTQGMSLLQQSGVFDVLRENGRVMAVSPELDNYVQYQAAIANQSVGYNAAIDHLIHFREMFLDKTPSTEVSPDFGAGEKAVETGDLTQGELDAVRSGKPIPHLTPIKSSVGGNQTS